MSSPDHRAMRQLRHDVDDVYELLDSTTRSVNTIASTQRRHSSRLEDIQQALDLQNGRLDRIEDTQRQILDLLRRPGRNRRAVNVDTGGGFGAGCCGWSMRSRAHPVRIGGAP